MKLHPCQTCGACCAQYRVSFYWYESTEGSFHVPTSMCVPSAPHYLSLKTNETNRCNALEGKLGEFVNCKIYQNRPSPCRDFKASFEDGTHDERCDQARARFGMRPLTSRDWQDSGLGLPQISNV